MKIRTMIFMGWIAWHLPGAALAACVATEPAAFAQHFFEKHRAFYHRPTTRLDEVVTPAFRRALAAHYRCEQTEGLCHIDYDPWLGAQDGEIRPPVAFSTTARQGDQATVRMTYQFVVAEPRGTRHQVSLLLRTRSADKCWQVDDLITPLGDSLTLRYIGPP